MLKFSGFHNIIILSNHQALPVCKKYLIMDSICSNLMGTNIFLQSGSTALVHLLP